LKVEIESMRQVLTSFLAFSFILWILPLGVFIKPCQEKLACDGQRAMCMCRIGVPKSPDKPMEAGISLKAGTSTAKENSSGGGAGYFVSAKPSVNLNLPFFSAFESQYLCYKNPNLPALENVPKI